MFEIEKLSLGVLMPYENNPRINENAVQAVANSIKEFGFNVPIIIDKNNVIVAGHTRYEACKLLGVESIPCHRVENLTDEQVRAYRLADNKTAELADWDFSKLEEELATLELDMGDFGFTNFDLDLEDKKGSEENKKSLSERFIVPPFSVLDTRQGYWQDRKREWKSIGLKSEVGRSANLLKALNDLSEKARSGSRVSEDESVFDPFLCEIMYTWFGKKGANVLDPFAGGSVRGIVAAVCGLEYVGFDVREEQIKANVEQIPILEGFEGSTTPTWVLCDSSKMNSVLADDYKADLVFTCPPYFDLEVYSDQDDDLSNMSVADFSETYKQVIKNCCERLNDNRFAVFVVGESRDKAGNYNNIIGLTIDSFRECGLHFYNEISLVNQVGSKALTASECMSKTRKVGKCHQNVLVFLKGDARKAVEYLGEIKGQEVVIS